MQCVVKCLSGNLPRILGIVSLIVLLTDLSACGGLSHGSHSDLPVTAPIVSGESYTSLSGTVMSGAKPVAGALVLAYAAASSASSAPLAATRSSDAGAFSFKDDIPLENELVYIVVEGGDAGGGNNADTQLLSVAGTACTSNNCGFPTSVSVTPLSTVAAAFSFAAFLHEETSSINIVGSGIGLTNAALTFSQLVDVGTGLASTTLTNCSSTNCLALQKLDTLANITAACVESTAASSTCTDYLTQAGAAPDVLQAAIKIATVAAQRNSGAALFALAPSVATYSPVLTAAPTDWSVAQSFTGGGIDMPTGLAVDSSGNVWIADEVSGTGRVSELSPIGLAISPSTGYTGGGLNGPVGILVGSKGDVWVANWASGSGTSVTRLSADGSVLSGSSGYSGGGILGPIALAQDTSGNVWVANYGNSTLTQLTASGTIATHVASTDGGLSYPTALAIDSAGALWVVNEGGDSISEFDSSGTVISTTAYSGVGEPDGIAIDSAGNAWVSDFSAEAIVELFGGQTPLSACPTTAVKGDTGCPVQTGGFTGGGLAGPAAIVIDGSGAIWVANYHGNSITELAASGSALSPSSGYGSGVLTQPFGLAVDASGNLWVSNYGSSQVTKFIGLATPSSAQ